MDKETLYKWATDLFPMPRSLTGQGVRDTLTYIKNIIPELEIKSIPSGTKVFDWEIPKEWVIREAYIKNEHNELILDFKANNLHVLGYSEPKNAWVDRVELENHLHSLANLPDAIPYRTSYYEKKWGFCISHNQRMKLKDRRYYVYIDSEQIDGGMNYGELIIEGETNQEILLSTYICHPSMANDNVSGIVVTMALIKEILLKPRKYTYRILFLPETIGAIAYLSKNLKYMQAVTIAGFVITCCGNGETYSLMPSKAGNTLADKIARCVLSCIKDSKQYLFSDRGSDERQYCSPLVNLPVCSIMREKYAEYPEYHTSLDNLDFISAQGLYESVDIYTACLSLLEMNFKPIATYPCEANLGKRGLYQSSKNIYKDILAYADGEHDLLDLIEIVGYGEIVVPAVKILLAEGLLK